MVARPAYKTGNRPGHAHRKGALPAPFSMLPQMAGEAVATPLSASGEIVTPRPDRLGVADPDAEGGKLVIGLLQADRADASVFIL